MRNIPDWKGNSVSFCSVFLLLSFLSVAVGALRSVAKGELSMQKDSTRITVKSGEQPLLVYRFSEVPYKPYVEKLYSPEGVNVLRDSPADHKHHHGLMFAVSVDGISFWEEHQAPGMEKHIGFPQMGKQIDQEMETAFFSEDIEWINPRTGSVRMLERRSIRVYPADDLGATLLTWKCHLSLPPGKATAEISGHRYYGLGMRFLQSMDKGEGFLNAEGKTGVEGTNDVKSTWCSYTAEANGRPITVAMFDHPENPRHPAIWFTMNDPFAYLSATMAVHRDPILLKPESPMALSYGVALWDGSKDRPEIESLYQRWLNLVSER